MDEKIWLPGNRGFDGRPFMQRERQLANILEPYWGCRIEHLGERSPIDWAAFWPDVRGYIEVKIRGCSMRKYPETLIPAHKVQAMLRKLSLGSPCYVVSVWTDPILAYCPVDRMAECRVDRSTGWIDAGPGGQRRQQDNHLVPVEWFKKIYLREDDNEALKRLSGPCR